MDKRYKLCNTEAREKFDFKKYEPKMKEAVLKIAPNAELLVYEDSYILKNIEKGEAIRIGKAFCNIFPTWILDYSRKLCTGSEI